MSQDKSDKSIRESYFKKDKDFNDKIRQEMEEEETMLKSYFKQYKQPVKEDPSIVKRQTNQQKTLLIKEMLSPFRVFRTFYQQFWNKDCATPEQRYVLNLCKQNVKKQMTVGILGSLTITTLTSLRMRMSLSPKIHFLSFMVGITSGILYGVISSSQYSLEKFQQLGENYALGRSSLLEIQKFRMDKRN